MIGDRIAVAIRNTGSTVPVVAAAADMRPAELESAIRGEAPFEFETLVAVGGFLRLRVPDLFKEVAAL